MSGVNISICDGKYTVIQAPTGTTRVLRYGEEWRDVTGDNVIGGLAWELQEARDRIKRLEEALEGTVKWIVDLADSGDAGFWDVDEQPEIIAARAALQAKDAKL